MVGWFGFGLRVGAMCPAALEVTRLVGCSNVTKTVRVQKVITSPSSTPGDNVDDYPLEKWIGKLIDGLRRQAT